MATILDIMKWKINVAGTDPETLRFLFEGRWGGGGSEFFYLFCLRSHNFACCYFKGYRLESARLSPNVFMILLCF